MINQSSFIEVQNALKKTLSTYKIYKGCAVQLKGHSNLSAKAELRL
jgi:hypothetical protein